MSTPSLVFIQCVGALGALYAAMALRMSLYRMAGSPGEGKPNSPLTRFHDGQTLAAEWIGACAPVLLAMHLKAPSDPAVRLAAEFAAVALTAARFLFAANALRSLPHLFFGMIPMTTCYIAMFVLSGILIFA